MKKLHFFLQIACAFLAAGNARAIITYGESNDDAKILYDGSATAAELSVVSCNSASAVYLGGGWFITANHVGAAENMNIYQNGASAKISAVNNSLYENYGADLTLFYCADVSNLEYLAAANLSADIYSSISSAKFGYKTTYPGGVKTYTPTCTKGTYLTLVGAGYGRSPASRLDDAHVAGDGAVGTMRSGEASVFAHTADENGVGQIITIPEYAVEGSAQALIGDSGGGLFYEDAQGTFYLAGIMAGVAPSAYGVDFNSYENIALNFSPSGTPTGIDYSGVLAKSYTLSVNLSDYIPDIQAIISVPEPSNIALLLGIFAAAFLILRRKN
ncbi:MAG: PEP-CTERM sorting domain-containing protein [Opitutales bacterium]|nr:PEP-CTERM sorting domain-containing protein [Opitutales bacterium]